MNSEVRVSLESKSCDDPCSWTGLGEVQNPGTSQGAGSGSAPIAVKTERIQLQSLQVKQEIDNDVIEVSDEDVQAPDQISASSGLSYVPLAGTMLTGT